MRRAGVGALWVALTAGGWAAPPSAATPAGAQAGTKAAAQLTGSVPHR